VQGKAPNNFENLVDLDEILSGTFDINSDHDVIFFVRNFNRFKMADVKTSGVNATKPGGLLFQELLAMLCCVA
jgi:hypothetical protein